MPLQASILNDADSILGGGFANRRATLAGGSASGALRVGDHDELNRHPVHAARRCILGRLRLDEALLVFGRTTTRISSAGNVASASRIASSTSASPATASTVSPGSCSAVRSATLSAWANAR